MPSHIVALNEYGCVIETSKLFIEHERMLIQATLPTKLNQLPLKMEGTARSKTENGMRIQFTQIDNTSREAILDFLNFQESLFDQKDIQPDKTQATAKALSIDFPFSSLQEFQRTYQEEISQGVLPIHIRGSTTVGHKVVV